MFAVVFETPNH